MEPPAAEPTSRTPPETAATAEHNEDAPVAGTSKLIARARKRTKKRRRDDGKERHIAIKKERFDKLLYQARKDLQKQAKRCRAFLVQKSIRKMKQKEDGGTDVPSSSSSSSRLRAIKEAPLDRVAERAVRQLGLLHANPDPDADFAASRPPDHQQEDRVVGAILTHARFQKALEGWHEKVTDYRRWALNFDERAENRKNPGASATAVMRPIKKKQSTSIFCSLDGGDGGEEEETSPYGPGAYMEEVPVKKNRKGQRARRAKAMAIQAKKEGRKYESLNWRSEEERRAKMEKAEKEKAAEEETQHPSWNAKRNEPTGIVAFEGSKIKFGNEPAVETKAERQAPPENHPSWEAKKAQKSGIVAFKGTKITF